MYIIYKTNETYNYRWKERFYKKMKKPEGIPDVIDKKIYDLVKEFFKGNLDAIEGNKFKT